ncbi:MAG: ester cyclase [Calditrichaeota bacterium]|nr:MAG: ester cyclase [Calditrichota bacterium]
MKKNVRIPLIIGVGVLVLVAIFYSTIFSKDSTLEKNKAVVRNLFEKVINTGKIDLADKYVAKNIKAHEPLLTDEKVNQGLAGFKEWVQSYRKAFPDLKFRIEDLIAENNMVAVRFTMTGTHKGEFMGWKPTNKNFTVSGIDILRLKDGKCVEHWNQTDMLGLLKQLGIFEPAKLSAANYQTKEVAQTK